MFLEKKPVNLRPRKLSTGKLPPEIFPLGKLPSQKIGTRKNAAKKIALPKKKIVSIVGGIII